MDKELLGIAAITLSPLLYMLGGYHWKWMRRFLLPAVLGAILLLTGAIWWEVLIFAIAQAITFTLPYGERTPYWLKALVGCSFALPSLILGLTIWQAAIPIIFITTFILSNYKKTAKEFPWKICEGITGFLIGIIVARLM